MQHRGFAPRRSASAGAGLRLGASANAAAGNAAHLGLDLLTPLALALGAAEVETQAKAARQIRDLAREGSVSCAAASKSGTVAALVALATRRGNDIAEKDERLAADGEKATRLDKATQLSSPTNVVCFWSCARDAADALTALALVDEGEGKQIIAASAKTVASLLAAVTRSASDEDIFLRDGARRREREKEKNVSHLSSQRALARRSVTRLVFALADTTNTRVALAENRDALSAFARDAGSRDVALAAAAAGVLWVAASPPETLQRSPLRAKDPNAEESTRAGGTSYDAGVGPYPAATAAAGDVADAIARRHLSVLAEAAATAETFSADEGSGSVFSDSSLVRRRVALAAASVAGRDAARAAAVSRETKLMACLVRSVAAERKGEERRAAATALWKIVSGVLRRRLASGAAARVIDALVAETDLVRVLAEALLRETTTHDDDDDARAGVMALARLASSTLGALAGCAAFARRVAEARLPPPETFSTAATETNASPLDAILSFAIDTVGTSSSAWALWCAREAASASPGIAARCAAREGLAPALARAAAAGGDAGVFAAGLAWLCLTAAEEADDDESDAKTSSVSSGWEPRRANKTETESAVRNRRRVVSAFARALSSPPVQTMAGSRTDAGAFLAATLRSMTARCVAQDAEAASTSGSTLGDSTPNHARGVSFASAESFQTGPASAGGGAAARASDHLARRYHERRRSRAASGELGFWGSQELDVPGDSLGAGPRSTGYGARETPRSSFGMLASRFSRGSGGAGSLGRNRDFWCDSPEKRLGPESRRLAAAIVSATVRALERDGDDSSAEALLRGDLPRLLVGLACDGDGDDDLGARFADPERALEGSSLGASVDGDDSGADGTRGGFGTVPRTIHASAAPGLDSFLRAAGRACAAETGSGMSTDRLAFDVLTDPGEGLLLAAAAILASRDAAASREVAESLADVLARHRVRPGTPTESVLATAVAGQPGVLDGLARAACYGLAGASKQRLVGGWYGAYGDAPLPGGLAPYERTVARGGQEGGLNVAPPAASAPTPASPREDPNERGAPMITVPLPATPKGTDGADGAEGDPESRNQTESALARLILPPARDDGDETDDDDSFVSADGEDELPRDSDAAARRKRNDANAAKRNGGDSGEIPFLPPPPVFARSPRAATARTHTHTHNTHTGAHVGGVPNSNLGPSPSPREATARRRAASWIPAGAGSAGSPSASVRQGLSPRGHERAASVSGAALVSRRAPRGSLSARDELWDNRAAWAKRRERRRYSSTLSARRGAAAAALRAVAGLVLADASGKIAARVADHPETLHALAGALASLPRGGAEDEGDERRRSGVSSSSRDEKERPSREGGDFHSGGQKSEALVAAAARAAASLARRGERDRVVESVFFGSAADASGRIAHADYSDSGPGSFASAATALVTAEPLVSAESFRARHAERVLDALLSLAVAASSRGISSVSLEHSSVAAAECLASFATHPRVAEAMAAHGKVFPQLVALAAPPHGAATAAPAADAIANALVASPPPPGSDAAETVWSVDAVEVLVKACQRDLELDHDVNNVERNAFPYGQTFVAAETNRAAAASLRLLAAVAMTAEDDASRADIAIEPGVLGVVEALLNEERPEREVREERGRSWCLVLAGACRLSAELARTPAALAAARAETEMADVEGSAFLGGLLRALDTSSSEATVMTEHDDASYDARSALGDTDARVASMCALSRLAAANGDIARALASAPTFVSAANRAVAAAAAASRAGGGGGGGGGGASIPANETASDVYWLAAHAACALTACAEALRGRASADGVGAGILIFPASPTRAEDESRDSAVGAGVGSRRLARDLAELVGGGDTSEASHTETHEAVESRVPKRVPPHGDTRFAPVPAAGSAAPLSPLGSAAPGTLRARRGAAALALAVGDAAGPMGKQSGSIDSSTRRDVFTSSRASSLRARLAASLGAARLLRVEILSDSGDAFLNAEPKLKAGGEEKKCVVADAAHAFLRAMSRFGGSLSDSRNDGQNDDALTKACTSAVIKTAAECLRALCVEDGAAVAAVVADDASGAAARALSAAVARINRPSFPPGFVSLAYRDETRSTDDSSFGFVSSPRPSARHGHATTRTPSQSAGAPASHKTRFGSARLLPSRDDALAAAAALAVVVDVARRVPESVVAVSRASGIVGALAGFLDQASFAMAREAAGEKFADFAGIFFTGEERRGENSRAEKTSFFDVALPPPFAYPFGPPTGVRPGSVQGIPETNGASRLASYGQTVGGIGANDARTVAADVFAAVAAVAPARVVAADSLPIRRAARGLAAIVAETSNASAARTAAARALWSLCLAEGDGAAAVDAAPGAVAALAGALAETTLCPYEDNTTRSGSDDEFRRRVSSSETTFASYAMHAAAAGALGAVFSSAAADSRDPTRALRCVNAAFDVEGASRGFADVARGGDADGALAAAAAVAAATRVPAGAARVAADQALLAALRDVAGAPERRAPADGEEKIDTDAVGARAAEALANLAAHTSSVEVLASSPAASTLWVEAATLLFASRQAETRAAIVGAARSFLRRTGKQPGAADVDARFARAVADRLADKKERLSTRVDAAGCASFIATSVYGTLEEPAFVEALVTAFRFVGDASAEKAGETMRDEGSERDDTLRKARLRQLARLAATATRNLCAQLCLLRDENENENGNEKSSLSADRLARAAKEAAGAWRVGGADAATAAAVAEALEFLARHARRSWKVNQALSDGAESSMLSDRSGLAEAASAAAGALVAAAVAGTAEPPGAFASPGSPASPGSGRSPGALSGPSRAVFFAACAVSAIAALALAGETCVAAFVEDTARRDALLTALALGMGSSVPKERLDEKEPKRLSLASCRTLRALAGTNEAWAAVVAARCFDALIDRLRYAASVANSSEIGPSARVSAADVDEISVDVEVDDAAATSENSLVPVKETFSVAGDAARSAEAMAASSLRRCLDFGALDEAQALALAAPGAGLLEGALACIVAGGDASRVGSCAESRRRSLSPIAARFALDGASRACVFVDVFDDDDDDDDDDNSAEDIEIPPETVRVAGIRTLVALASTSATAARAAASAALSFSFLAKNAIAADAGGGVSGPIAALAETARSVAFRDFAVDAASSERDAELAVAVCEAVAVLAGASRKARRAFVREEGFVAAFESMGLGANPAVAAAAAAAAESLSAR